MALTAIQVTIQLTEINCGECGGTYALNERYRQQCSEKGKSWNCPYCQAGWGYQKGEMATLREQLEAEKGRRMEALSRANEANAENDRLARKLKRVGNGLCPDCNRTFTNLARHIACKHKAKAA